MRFAFVVAFVKHISDNEVKFTMERSRLERALRTFTSSLRDLGVDPEKLGFWSGDPRSPTLRVFLSLATEEKVLVRKSEDSYARDYGFSRFCRYWTACLSAEDAEIIDRASTLSFPAYKEECFGTGASTQVNTAA